MADPQTTLLAVPPSAPSTRRTTSKGIGPGDIVEVDKRGRRFHAIVKELEQLESGRFELALRPLDSRISYRTRRIQKTVRVGDHPQRIRNGFVRTAYLDDLPR